MAKSWPQPCTLCGFPRSQNYAVKILISAGRNRGLTINYIFVLIFFADENGVSAIFTFVESSRRPTSGTQFVRKIPSPQNAIGAQNEFIVNLVRCANGNLPANMACTIERRVAIQCAMLMIYLNVVLNEKNEQRQQSTWCDILYYWANYTTIIPSVLSAVGGDAEGARRNDCGFKRFEWAEEKKKKLRVFFFSLNVLGTCGIPFEHRNWFRSTAAAAAVLFHSNDSLRRISLHSTIDGGGVCMYPNSLNNFYCMWS